jgi:hypothetical protein
MWRRATRSREHRAFYEKAWRRSELPPWDAKWHGLSVQARHHFVHQVKFSVTPGNPNPPAADVDNFPPEVLEELIAAGLIAVRTVGRSPSPRVVLPDAAIDFAARVRGLGRYHLLAEDLPSELKHYADACFFTHGLVVEICNILHRAGVEGSGGLPDLLQRYVSRHRWPGWVADTLHSEWARPLLDVLEAADGPIPLTELCQRVGGNAQEVRATLDGLVGRLALVEDLDARTQEILVGLLPEVRSDLRRARAPRSRPPLVPCPEPKEVGPDGGPDINDLRVFLLDVAGTPPRLKQDGSLYQKEGERLIHILEPLPDWFTQALGLTLTNRLLDAFAWARTLGLVKDERGRPDNRLHLSPRGEKWLGNSLESQRAHFYKALAADPKERAPYPSAAADDSLFLGAYVVAVPVGTGRRPSYWHVDPADRQALRDAVFRALAELPAGVFHRLDSFLAHATFGRHNPLLLGQERPDQVAVFWSGRSVPALEEQREEAGRLLLDHVIRGRLIPLGCLRTALAGDGGLCIARVPRLDAYFGQQEVALDLPDEAAAGPRVVVQPDFSVVIIGLNPTPAAELAPFCERAQGHAGQGVLVFKLTRDAVVRAVTHGLAPAEIVDRLQRHASNPVPANVLHEVRGWCEWVRRLTPEAMTVFRCPDRETADRVLAALGRDAQRLGDTLVGLAGERLGTAVRNKLHKQGIIVS